MRPESVRGRRLVTDRPVESDLDSASVGRVSFDLQPALLTIRDVVRLAQLSERAIRHRVALGQFPAPIRFGRAKRWHRSTLLAWFAAGCPPLDRFGRAR